MEKKTDRRKNNKIYTNSTLCWDCYNAVPIPNKNVGCSWSKHFIPVEGWEADKVDPPPYLDRSKGDKTSYFVNSCPKFIPDPPRGTSPVMIRLTDVDNFTSIVINFIENNSNIKVLKIHSDAIIAGKPYLQFKLSCDDYSENMFFSNNDINTLYKDINTFANMIINRFVKSYSEHQVKKIRKK